MARTHSQEPQLGTELVRFSTLESLIDGFVLPEADVEIVRE